MHFIKSCLLFSLCSYAVSAAPSSSASVLHEKRGEAPSHWVKRSSVPAEAKLPVRIGLKHRNLDLGHDHLMDISNPSSENFGKHWTKEQVDDFFSPHEQSWENVFAWLTGSNIDVERLTTSRGRGLVTFEATIGEIEALLNTKYHFYEHSDSGDFSISCDEYSIHHSVRDHIDFVTPTIDFAKVKRSRVKRSLPQKRETVDTVKRWANDSQTVCVPDAILPSCVQAFYGIETDGYAHPGNELGIYENFDTYDEKDLNIFFSNLYPQIPNGTFPELNSIVGGQAPTTNASYVGGESVVDLEMSYPIIYPQQIRLFQVGDLTKGENYSIGEIDYLLDAFDASYCSYEGGDNITADSPYPDPLPGGYQGQKMCGGYKPTNVVSISYGEEEASFSDAYVNRQCSEIMKLGMQGVSFIVASGDQGAVGHERKCLPGGRYNPNYPATCPYLTSVGGTKLVLKNKSFEEVAVLYKEGPYSSGGGFSNKFSRPSYQDSAVSKYLSSAKGLNSSLFNSSGRGYPDVSAFGQNLGASVLAKLITENGTSLSAPIFASMITLVNEKRLESGKGPVGFLNPTLYSNPSMFTDIVAGHNLDCKNATAFKAIPGWDPVTGLGSPVYSKLLNVFMNLP